MIGTTGAEQRYFVEVTISPSIAEQPTNVAFSESRAHYGLNAGAREETDHDYWRLPLRRNPLSG
jgi:hypothetical protein